MLTCPQLANGSHQPLCPCCSQAHGMADLAVQSLSFLNDAVDTLGRDSVFSQLRASTQQVTDDDSQAMG